MEGQYSNQIRIKRGVRQGNPLSPLLFALALEPLTVAIWKSKRTIGFRIQHAETKMALYSVFLKIPWGSIRKRRKVMSSFGQLSGYKIKQQ